MDFDPGECYDDSEHYESHDEMAEDSYEAGFDDSTAEFPEAEDTSVVETDEFGSPVYLAAAAGFGYHMSEEDIEERQIAEGILKKKEREHKEPIKVPLAQRHEHKGYSSPFDRWARRASMAPKDRNAEMEYTLEEQLAIIEAEGKGHE